ncbi:hypothetical protein IW150_007244, partial [Coemansia sp. RSA 2607]
SASASVRTSVASEVSVASTASAAASSATVTTAAAVAASPAPPALVKTPAVVSTPVVVHAAKTEPSGPSRPAGLAKLALNAVAAAAHISTARKLRTAGAPGGHKSLPAAPDRVARTLSAAAAAAAPDAGRLNAQLPPLPQSERPRVPRELADSGLGSAAEVAAAGELPSAQSLFALARQPSSLSQAGRLSVQHLHMHGVPAQPGQPGQQPVLAAYTYTGQSGGASEASPGAATLDEWLRRTDALLPSNNPVEKPPPYPPGGEGKVTFNTYYYEPAAPSPLGGRERSNSSGAPGAKAAAGGSRNSSSIERPATAQGAANGGRASPARTRGRVVRTVTLVPPALPPPSLYSYPHSLSSRRSHSPSFSIHSSASHLPPANSAFASPRVLSEHSPFGSRRASINSAVSIPASSRSSTSLHSANELES